jgi:spore coat polysaccharide biosynthesis protein SpsF
MSEPLIVAITQARMSSTRLPGKILMNVGEVSLLELHLHRISGSRSIGEVIVATTDDPADDPTARLVTDLGFTLVRGSQNDVLARFAKALCACPKLPNWIVRLTADCPLIDPALIDEVVAHAIEKELDYCSNTLLPSYPDGQDVEVVRSSSLLKAVAEANSSVDREHVTPYVWRNSSFFGGTLFTSENHHGSGVDLSGLRMTVDEPNDLAVIRELVVRLGSGRPWTEYAALLQADENLRSLNVNFQRNEGFARSLAQQSSGSSSVYR